MGKKRDGVEGKGTEGGNRGEQGTDEGKEGRKGKGEGKERGGFGPPNIFNKFAPMIADSSYTSIHDCKHCSQGYTQTPIRGRQQREIGDGDEKESWEGEEKDEKGKQDLHHSFSRMDTLNFFKHRTQTASWLERQ